MLPISHRLLGHSARFSAWVTIDVLWLCYWVLHAKREPRFQEFSESFKKYLKCRILAFGFWTLSLRPLKYISPSGETCHLDFYHVSVFLPDNLPPKFCSPQQTCEKYQNTSKGQVGRKVKTKGYSLPLFHKYFGAVCL